MDISQIKELVALLNSTDLEELEIENEGFRLYLRKAAQAAPATLLEVESPKASAAAQTGGSTNLLEVLAPMVGTFYRSPAPEAAPYVQIGDQISAGQVLFIIEAMKMMNEIQAEIQGVVKQFLVENGDSVEYGQPLILIEPRL